MEPFRRLTAIAAPLDLMNVETDRIFPSRYLKKPLGPEYADYLFHDLRFDAAGRPKPDFVLNQPAFREARILVAGRNFGCGSAREGAVYALVEYGIRVVIAPSFGDIFFGNCLTNGVLPIRLDEPAVDRLRDILRARPGTKLGVDLERQTLNLPDQGVARFELDPFWRDCLMRGHDSVDLTLRREAEIAQFEAAYLRDRPWLFGRR